MHPYDLQSSGVATEPQTSSIEEIFAHCNQYKGADTTRSLFQLFTTLALFAATCAAMIYGLSLSFWASYILLLPAAGLLTRIFIFKHDCGHRSFFKSKKVNDWVGRALSVLTFTPYDFWRRAHNMHHATSGDLDRRSIGGIDTVTVEEYKSMPRPKQLAYRLYRNSFFMIILGTPIYTLVGQRMPFNAGFNFYEDYKTLSTSSIWKSIMLTNFSLLAFYAGFVALFGWAALFMVYIPIVIVTSWIGGWLFYVQHQFEDAYWERNEDWNVLESALHGSSYYKLPKILQWFTGNIGLHHIHHLCSGIPNYKLEACMEALPELKEINVLHATESLQCKDLKLWDEEKKAMIPLSAVESA